MFMGDRAPVPLTSTTHQCDGVQQCLAERRDFESNGPQSRPPAQRPLLILALYSPKRPFSLDQACCECQTKQCREIVEDVMNSK